MKAAIVPKPNLSLLIVDDHALVREGLLQLFQSHKHFTVAGITVEKAVSAARHQKPDVIIFGLEGATCSCWPTIHSLCNQFPAIHLLILDEKVTTRNIHFLIKAGIRAYWTKHATFSELAEAVSILALGGTSFCPEVDKHISRTHNGLHYNPAKEINPLQMLTKREAELFILLAHGYALKECAEKMSLSINTVDNHKTRLMRKLQFHKNIELVRLAMREGILA